MLEIDISGSNEETDGEDLMEIKLKSQNTTQINFSKFLVYSKYVCSKCSEIMKSIEKEITEVGNKFEMKEEIMKEFIEIISEDKVSIPIEHYKDIYTLSKHFCIPKLTNLLDNIMKKLFVKDLNFSIQILLDRKENEIEIARQIENFLKTRVNECLKNDKFKELPIQTIYRIIESAILNDRERVDVNILLDFIVESAVNRFILFRFVEFHRMSKDKIDEFIKFIDMQDEKSKVMYLEYIPFNFLFFKEMKQKNDELSKQNNQIQLKLQQTQNELEQKKEESKQTKEELKQKEVEIKRMEKELKQTQEESKQMKVELKQTKEEIEQFKDKFNHAKSYMKKGAYAIIVGGFDKYNHLGEKPNNKYGNYPVIFPPQKSSIDPSSLLSISIYCNHLVEITRSGKLLGIGNNRNGQISDSLPKTGIKEFTEFLIRDCNGRQLDPISAVCSLYGTLYILSSGSRRHLVLCDEDINGGHPVFLDIGDEQPVSLFGGRSHSAAINNKGEVIFINRFSIKKSPKSKIETVFLPDGEKAVSVACCDDSVVALSSNGRAFLSVVSQNNVLNFSTVSELSGQEIIWVSGVYSHFLAVSREGRVFGRGSNSHGELCLGKQTSKVASFTEISSLNCKEIKAAYAGWCHSLFETREGKIIACGYNKYGQLLINSNTREDVFAPRETTITESASFCIAGCSLSAVFIEGEPPPNTPNRLIEKT